MLRRRRATAAPITAVTFFSDRACLDPSRAAHGTRREPHALSRVRHLRRAAGGPAVPGCPSVRVVQNGGRYDATWLSTRSADPSCAHGRSRAARSPMPEAEAGQAGARPGDSAAGSSAVVGAALMLVAAGCCLGLRAGLSASAVGRRRKAGLRPNLIRMGGGGGRARLEGEGAARRYWRSLDGVMGRPRLRVQMAVNRVNLPVRASKFKTAMS